jgi:hypothetical protein
MRLILCDRCKEQILFSDDVISVVISGHEPTERYVELCRICYDELVKFVDDYK